MHNCVPSLHMHLCWARTRSLHTTITKINPSLRVDVLGRFNSSKVVLYQMFNFHVPPAEASPRSSISCKHQPSPMATALPAADSFRDQGDSAASGESPYDITSFRVSKGLVQTRTIQTTLSICNKATSRSEREGDQRFEASQ
jgi:hypothetical protein